MTMSATQQTVAYRGYLIVPDLPGVWYFVMRDGFRLATVASPEAARDTIDLLVTP